MSNPNNCSTCEYKTLKASGQADGHCYMFREEPTDVCAQHTLRMDLAAGMQKVVDLLLRTGYCDRIK